MIPSRALRGIFLAGSIALTCVAQEVGTSAAEFFRQGLVALQANNLGEALEAFTSAERLQPDDARIHNFHGITLMSMGRSDEAAQEYRRAIELDPQMEPAFRNLGFLSWTAHRDEEAQQDLSRALQLDPDDAFAAYYLARLDIAHRNPARAASLFKPFAEKSLGWAEFDLALVSLRAGEYKTAADLAQTTAKHCEGTELASAYSLLGIAQSKLKHEDQSVAAFREAASVSPAQEEHWLNLTRAQMDSNHLSDAIASVQEGLKAHPKSYALHLRLGAVYLSAGKYAEAENAFRELLAAGDPLPTSAIGVAQVLLRTGRAKEAAALLGETEHRLGPQFLLIYFEGLAYDRAGDRSNALDAFQRAAKINPGNAEAHLGIGKTLLAMGQPKDAVRELQLVLRIAPDNKPARRLLSQAYARLGVKATAANYADASSVSEFDPGSNLVGDFILPDWQQPTPR